MRLYVTGGTGLVGSNVIRLARQRGSKSSPRSMDQSPSGRSIINLTRSTFPTTRQSAARSANIGRTQSSIPPLSWTKSSWTRSANSAGP